MTKSRHSNRRGARGWALASVVALVWLAAWTWVPGAFTVWGAMFVVYVGALGATILFAPRVGQRPHFDFWRERFFRTGGYVVLSGVLTMALLFGGLAFFWRRELRKGRAKGAPPASGSDTGSIGSDTKTSTVASRG